MRCLYVWHACIAYVCAFVLACVRVFVLRYVLTHLYVHVIFALLLACSFLLFKLTIFMQSEIQNGRVTNTSSRPLHNLRQVSPGYVVEFDLKLSLPDAFTNQPTSDCLSHRRKHTLELRVSFVNKHALVQKTQCTLDIVFVTSSN